MDGADVCLFGMYVQEYGSECTVPNQRRVCISYLDYVKYFRPEIKAANGEALRTLVYHEILIGYLDYCKKRGFTSCYIWSCPSANQDDYILYCHPTTQKMPKPQSLRKWYEKIIRKAKKRTIVVEHTNLYDHYFKPSRNAKVTASRLPYFDGDCWTGEAEKFLKEDMCEKKETKRQRPSKDFNSEDFRIMDHIGKRISRIKKEFIMVHFQHTCKHCSQHIVSGSRWVCYARKNFHLCDKCHSLEKEGRTKTKRKQVYYKVKAENVPADTKDEDGILHSEHLESRVMLLKLCQKNFYQFDTLRRAKHTTMMILYHIHKSISTCNLVNDKQKQRQQQFWQKMLDLLVHTSKCTAPTCTYGGCSKLKILFRHGKACQTRVTRNCKHCKKMWLILEVHASNCKESECSVPRCRDLKAFLRRKARENET